MHQVRCSTTQKYSPASDILPQKLVTSVFEERVSSAKQIKISPGQTFTGMPEAISDEEVREDDDTLIEPMQPGAMDLAKKVVAQLHEANDASDLEFLALGGFNCVFLEAYFYSMPQSWTSLSGVAGLTSESKQALKTCTSYSRRDPPCSLTN